MYEDAMAAVRELMDRQFGAIRTKDLDRLMTLYADDVVYFDVVPPLQFAGAEALRDRFRHWFDGYQGPIDVELRDLTIAASADMAVARGFSRAAGTLTNGREVGVWVRVTSCSRRTDRGWLVFHEHVSLPVDVAAGRPAMDLVP